MEYLQSEPKLYTGDICLFTSKQKYFPVQKKFQIRGFINFKNRFLKEWYFWAMNPAEI